MKVAFITPYYLQATRGNAVTVRRLERHLSAAGCRVRVFSLEEYGGPKLLQAVRAYAPACIHAFHALHGGEPARLISRALGVPYLITLTGTDLYAVEAAAPDRGTLHEILSGAAALVVFHERARQRLRRLVPPPLPPIAVIPQGVETPCTVPPEPGGDVVFLLPAGIRPVKNVMFPIAPLARLHAVYSQVRLVVAGPVLDETCAGEFRAAIDRSPHAEWLGELPFEAMPGLYARSHVVLNTSLSEGMANSLLEAMAYGRPVLAADIEGNRSLVQDGVNGMLYRDEGEFQEKAELLLTSSDLRVRLGSAGRQFVGEHCSPEREAERYLELFRRVAGEIFPP